MIDRRGDKAYCYLSRREGGRVRRVYAGSGPEALRAEAERRAARRQAAARRADQREEARRAAEAERIRDDYSRLLEVLVRAVLTARGFRQHHRGEWRRVRHGG